MYTKFSSYLLNLVVVQTYGTVRAAVYIGCCLRCFDCCCAITIVNRVEGWRSFFLFVISVVQQTSKFIECIIPLRVHVLNLVLKKLVPREHQNTKIGVISYSRPAQVQKCDNSIQQQHPPMHANAGLHESNEHAFKCE